MRILVIGGTRFIGPFVVRRLVELGHDVTLFHRGQTEPETPLDAQHVHGDRAEITSFAAQFVRLRPDAVIDMGALNERHALTLLEAVRGATDRVVLVSSVDVYRAYGRLHRSEPGPPDPTPLTESSPLREQPCPDRGAGSSGRGDYDKIPAERAVSSSADIRGSIIRLPAVLGEGDYQHRLFMELARFDAKRPFVLVQRDAAGWRWSRGYAGNVADAIALVATDERAAGGTYHVAEPSALTQTEWIQAVANSAGWHGDIIEAPREALPQHLTLDLDFAHDLAIDSRRVRDELGYAERVSGGGEPELRLGPKVCGPQVRVGDGWIRRVHGAPP